jgi:hypothetical protein
MRICRFFPAARGVQASRSCVRTFETNAIIEIRWPTGRQEKIEDVAADQLLVVCEGAGMVRRDSFKKA